MTKSPTFNVNVTERNTLRAFRDAQSARIFLEAYAMGAGDGYRVEGDRVLYRPSRGHTGTVAAFIFKVEK